MAVSKAQQKAVAKYMKNNYDELKVRVPKGRKDIINNSNHHLCKFCLYIFFEK